MTENEQLEALMGAGFDAEAALRNADVEDQEACVDADGCSIGDHLGCLSCSETIADAIANIRGAVATIDMQPKRVRSALKDVRDALVGGLEEVGLSLHQEKAS